MSVVKFRRTRLSKKSNKCLKMKDRLLPRAGTAVHKQNCVLAPIGFLWLSVHVNVAIGFLWLSVHVNIAMGFSGLSIHVNVAIGFSGLSIHVNVAVGFSGLSVHVNVAIGLFGLPMYINVAIVCISVFLDKVHRSVSSLPSRHRRVRDRVPMQSVLREPPGRVPVQVCSRLRSGKGPVLLQVCGK